MAVLLRRDLELELVVLLDIMMPGIDGFETCRRFKADPALCDIPILMVSARDQEDDIVKGLDVGAVDYITKPVNDQFTGPHLPSRIAKSNASTAQSSLRSAGQISA